MLARVAERRDDVAEREQPRVDVDALFRPVARRMRPLEPFGPLNRLHASVNHTITHKRERGVLTYS